MACLHITDSSGNNWLVTLSITKHFYTIGRASDNDVVLCDEFVSRYHAFIKYEDGFFLLVDSGSLNHVFINDSRCHEQRLFNGDRIAIGQNILIFSQHDDLFADSFQNMEKDRTALNKNKQKVFEEPFAAPVEKKPRRIGAYSSIPAPIRKDITGERGVISSIEPVSTHQAEMALRNSETTKASRRSEHPNRLAAGDVVDCSVFAPPCVNPQINESFLIQVFAHLFDKAEEAKNFASEFDETARRRGCKSLETEIERGSKLIFHLSMPGFEILFPVQTLIWRGNTDSVQFAVEIPQNMAAGNKLGIVTISQDSVPIGQISFILKLSPTKDSQQPDLTGEASLYRNAFISYAASDRNEVLKRVQMLARLRINFFQDLLSLEPGQRWEREIYHHIDESDVFFLFWSSAAKASHWVMEEVSYAIKRKHGDETRPPVIIPVIIEGPPPVTPPQALAHLHFNDYLLYLQA